MSQADIIIPYIQQWVGSDACPFIIDRLHIYGQHLQEYNQHTNLIGPREINTLWHRHILDSAQVYPLIQTYMPGSVIDIGSGAGFPGLILSMMGIDSMILIESIGKKAKFLKLIQETLNLKVDVFNGRIESYHLSGQNSKNILFIKPAVITARAVATITQLLEWSKNIRSKETVYFLLKGEKAPLEIQEAQKNWKFKHTLYPSITSSSGHIVKLENILPHQ